MKKNLMKALRCLPMNVGIILVAGLHSFAGDIKLIANSSVATDTISAREIKNVFLGENISLGGAHVEPVLEKGGTAHQVFLKEYLGISDNELQTRLHSLVFTGRGSMPKTLGSDAEVVAYVAKTRGAIGYVSPETSTLGVKTLTLADAGGGAERKLITRIEPDYPAALREHSIGGTVRLKVTISPNGNVENAELLGGNPVLAEAAMAAVSKWKYAAAASRTTAEVRIPFDPRQ